MPAQSGSPPAPSTCGAACGRSAELTENALPTVLVASDGRHPVELPRALSAGILLRDTDLPVVVSSAASSTDRLALDLDTVRGLDPGDAAVDFVVGRLGIGIILTRRLQAATRAAEQGALGLLHVLAFDSTGLGRALDGDPRAHGVGCVVSPGLVLMHMPPSDLDRLPRPLVGYGLISDPSDAVACLELADGVVLRAPAAQALEALARTRSAAVRVS
jgi:glycerol-3-phosphate responsive antiterminator